MSGDWASQVPSGVPSSTAGSPLQPANVPQSGPGGPLGGAASRHVAHGPSPLPDVIAIIGLVLSAVLALATAPEATIGRMPVIGGLASLAASGPGELIASRAVTASLFGYLLTPFIVVGALAWARQAGLAKMDDPWFDRFKLRAQMRRLQSMTLFAFIFAIPHVVIIARAIQASIGLGR